MLKVALATALSLKPVFVPIAFTVLVPLPDRRMPSLG
jgi:hypothetical protein